MAAIPQGESITPAAPGKTQHTPGPWSFAAKLSASENHKGFGVWGASGPSIAEVYPLDEDGIKGEANAHLIVRAVNNHKSLLAALERLWTIVGEAMIDDELDGSELSKAHEHARNAIAAVRGVTP